MADFWDDVRDVLLFIAAYATGVSGLVILLGSSIAVALLVSPWLLFATIPIGLFATALTMAAAHQIIDRWM